MCGIFAARVLCAAACLLFGGARAGLYTDSDQVAILTPANVHELLFNSSNAVLLEFYASCLKPNGDHTWIITELLTFIKHYYSGQRLLNDYVSNTTATPPPPNRRRAREAGPEQEHKAGDKQDKEMVGKVPGSPQAEKLSQKPNIMGLQQRLFKEDILDPDSFNVQHYKAKATLKRRDMRDKVEPHPQSIRRTKRDVSAQQAKVLAVEVEVEPYVQSRMRWMFMLSGGFSRLDVSLCVTLYMLSTLCIVAMCLYFRMKRRQRRTKDVLP
ncbi:Sulfhydryl oxidase 1 [Bagarius yarrelli]|uniref:Sulfhydryl oxidase 1 n=1 Tax=Bagarius yarrelli TaxID=175774 RepID=A0A556VV46_BAGYA|nr:Sulfhydryl oxidase 1 [Bagarius yarrelli]